MLLMVFSFLQRRCHPRPRCIKKTADQPCYNVIFYLRRTEHKYLKGVRLRLLLIKKCCQIAALSTSYFERQKKKEKNLHRKQILYITDHVV